MIKSIDNRALAGDSAYIAEENWLALFICSDLFIGYTDKEICKQ